MMIRVPTLLLTKKSRTFPGLSRTPWTIFQDLFGARKFTYNIQSVVHCRKFSMKQNVDISCSEFRWTYGLYIHAVIIEKYMTFNDIFPGLSRTLSFYFQDFPGPKWFSRTFQVLEFWRKKSRTFQEAWEPWWSFSMVHTPRNIRIKSVHSSEKDSKVHFTV